MPWWGFYFYLRNVKYNVNYVVKGAQAEKPEGAEAVNKATRAAFTSLSALDFLCVCPLYFKYLLALNIKLTNHDDPLSDGERQLGLCVCRSGSYLRMPVKISYFKQTFCCSDGLCLSTPLGNKNEQS